MKFLMNRDFSYRTLLFKAEHNMSLGPQGKNPVPVSCHDIAGI